MFKSSFPDIDLNMNSAHITSGRKYRLNQANCDENDPMLLEFLLDMYDLQLSAPIYGNGRKRKPSLLEDLEEFVDVIGLDDLGSLEEMEVFSLDNDKEFSLLPKLDSSMPDFDPIEPMPNVSLIEDFTISKSGTIGLKNELMSVKPEKPVLEAYDVDSLLEQFEASAVNKNCPSTITEKVNSSPKPKAPEPILPPSVIQKIREMRSARKKSILIPPKLPTSVRGKSINSVQKPAICSYIEADPLQLGLEHDYCMSKDKLVPSSGCATEILNEEIQNCDDNNNKDESMNRETIVRSDSDDFDKLPPYLTCFTNKNEYKRKLDAGDEEQRTESEEKNIRNSRSRSRSPGSVSDCSTCSSCSCSSRSSVDSYRKSPDRGKQRRNSSRRRYSRSPDYVKSRSYSSSSASSEDDYSRSRSRNRSWIDKHWKRNPRRSPSYDKYDTRPKSPMNYNHNRDFLKYNSYNMPRISRFSNQKKKKDIEERKVIYVGNIPEGTTRDDLRKRFQKFGQIEEVSLHFRDNRDNYGFVTFTRQSDAYDAFENGNSDPTQSKFTLCFGGRRQFCKKKYSDLDNIDEDDDNCWGDQISLKKQKSKEMDFDSLLNAAKSRIFT